MKSILLYYNSQQTSGGIERVMCTLANKFSENYDVTLLVKDEPVTFYEINSKVKIETINNVLRYNMNSKVHRFFSVAKQVLKTPFLLKKFFKENNFDYIYVPHPLNALEIYLAIGINKKQTIITEHGGKNAYNIVYRGIKKWLYSKCKVYVVPTKTETKYYGDLGFPTMYIPHFRSELPYKKSNLESKNVLIIGRFTDIKQHLQLLKMWNHLYKNNDLKAWKLNIAGSGELESLYLDFINTNCLNDSVQLLPQTKEIEKYYLDSSIFVLTSKSEGFGMVLLEAISFGLPCITYDSPSGPRDIISSDSNGYLVGLDDEKDFENKLVLLINNRDKLEQLASNAYLSSENWADEVIMDMWNKILN